MNDDIDKADRIVGLTIAINHDWGCPSLNSWRDKIRRGAYFEWLDAKHACGLGPGAPLVDIAAEVVRIDAEERRTKEPDDGLPPGPWLVHHKTEWISGSRGARRLVCIDTSDGSPLTEDQLAVMFNYLVRCGSPAVRRLLAAYDVTDERVHDGSAAVIRMANESGTVCATRSPWAGADVLCWLTPRSKP